MSAAVATRELLSGLGDAARLPDAAVSGLAIDSRRVAGGELFLAYPGARLDGRAFIDEAVERGARVVAFDPDGFDYEGCVPGVPVAGLAGRVSEIAARFHGRPGAGLFVVGVTGTNGKTSCVHFLAQALEALGAQVGMTGTLGSGRPGRLDAGRLTTPDPVALQALLRRFADEGVTHVVMEVSSHALKQGRVAAVEFDVAVFTNLTRDHLDYHADVEDYAAAKMSLFEHASLRFVVVNLEDPVGRRIQARAVVRVIGYGGDAALIAGDLRVGAHGLSLRISDARGALRVSVPLVGRVNVANLLAVAGVLLEMGFEPDAVAGSLNRLTPVPGRMELFRAGDAGPTAVVDYAHTPDALARALESVREHCRARLWCVFGCGGDRDRGKRPEMGRVAERLADRVVLTNDNPRGESPEGIAAEIRAGMQAEPEVILDRRRAITSALEAARGDDWVLIAGKGHETYQIIGDSVLDFDDREVVSGCLGKAA